MRISDWSSDVCSSDLRRRGRPREVGRRIALLFALPRMSRVDFTGTARRLDGREIGRASFRARVCQYVLVSVVAVSLITNYLCVLPTLCKHFLPTSFHCIYVFCSTVLVVIRSFY